MKKSRIEIVDSVFRPHNQSRVKGFRVRLVAANGEILQHSEQLTTAAAVKKHIVALGKVFALTAQWELFSVTTIVDQTKQKIWKSPFN